MDVLRPPVVWIEGRCYRKLLSNVSNPQNYHEDEEESDRLVDFRNEMMHLEECENQYDIEEIGDKRFQTKFHVASAYYGFIIGTKGTAKKRIESETHTLITVPGFGKTGDIIIKGSDKRKVSSARTRIELIVRNSKRRQEFTHFLSVPLSGPAIKKGFLKFKSQILEKFKSDRGIDESLFQSPDKLHLTIGTLVLMDKEERIQASNVLEDCQANISSVVGKEPLTVVVKGLEIMNDDPFEVDVLYAKVESKDNRLQKLVNYLMIKFTDSEVMNKQYDRVKIHATVMNSLFRKSGSVVCDNEVTFTRDKPRETFNASSIIEEYKDFYFGDFTISDIHISERYSTNKNTGFYACTAQINIDK